MELQIQKAIELSLNPDSQASAAASSSGSSATCSPSKKSTSESATSSSTAGSGRPAADPASASAVHDPELLKVIELSQKEESDYKRRQDEEDETLQRILALSMTEK